MYDMQNMQNMDVILIRVTFYRLPEAYPIHIPVAKAFRHDSPNLFNPLLRKREA